MPLEHAGGQPEGILGSSPPFVRVATRRLGRRPFRRAGSSRETRGRPEPQGLLGSRRSITACQPRDEHWNLLAQRLSNNNGNNEVESSATA